MGEILQRLPGGAAVIELGCGSGTAAAVLADGRTYTGVDISAGQLALARERLPGETFLHGDLTRISFPDGTFDAVVALYVFNHVPQVEDFLGVPMFFAGFEPNENERALRDGVSSSSSPRHGFSSRRAKARPRSIG